MKWFQDGVLHFGVGIEDTFVPQTRPGERPLDEYALTEHYEHWHSDMGLAADAGCEFMRWGIPWYRVNPEPRRWDWDWTDRVIGRMGELGIRPVIDLIHYGTPMWLDREFANPDYPRWFAEYAVAAAERYADHVTDYTPVNEPMIHARFTGDIAYWPPHLSGEAGYNRISLALADGFVRAQRGIEEVLGDRATFVHVDATARFAGDVDGQHRELVELQRLQSFLVEDLVTGRVHGDHPMVERLLRTGADDSLLDWFVSNSVQPDVMGVNYYPRHSTQLMEEGVIHDGGFVDPWPTQDDGVTGLAELLRTYASRYGAPVMLTETCVTASVAERIAWLEDSVECVRALRRDGVDVVGYTWWPLFDMYEWTYRHAQGPREESLLTMGLWDLVETPTGLARRQNDVARRFRSLALEPRANAPVTALAATDNESSHMPSTHLVIDPARPIGTIDRRLFGGFVEHLGRHIYDGIYEPSHPTSDADGFRQDVIELVRELGVSTIRYPGGNFVSGFRWEDSVGPVADRPRRLDLAWHSTETNEVGLHEFQSWLEKVGSEMMLAVNLGTRGTQEALDLLEYANIPGGTELSERRVAHGRQSPFAVRMWCLGNEMDGPWQIGHRSADDYGKLAARTARAMRLLDPDLELVACGSSGAHMPTFGEWERVVLSHTFDEIDHISCHAYYEERDGDLGSFLASAVDMEHFIETVAATIDHVKAVQGSDRTVTISFDEWNVWYISRYENVDRITGIDNWPVAPRLLEDIYSVSDAVVFGSLMIALLKHAERVASASLAQLVNVIAPIMTEPGGPAWRQTTFYPFAITSRLARGVALDLTIDSPTYRTAAYGDVPLVDGVATHDTEQGQVALFLINRAVDAETTVSIALKDLGEIAVQEAWTLSDADPYAANTLADPERVTPHVNPTVSIDGDRLTITLPPVSWTAVSLG